MASYAFHATPRSNLPDIQREGLLGGGGYDPVHLALPEKRSGLVEFVSRLFQRPASEFVVLRVDVDGLSVEEGWDGEGTLAYNGTISPDRLDVIT